MPQKTFEFMRRTEATAALDLSKAGSPQDALDKVLSPPSLCTDTCVGSAYLDRMQNHIYPMKVEIGLEPLLPFQGAGHTDKAILPRVLSV